MCSWAAARTLTVTTDFVDGHLSWDKRPDAYNDYPGDPVGASH